MTPLIWSVGRSVSGWSVSGERAGVKKVISEVSAIRMQWNKDTLVLSHCRGPVARSQHSEAAVELTPTAT